MKMMQYVAKILPPVARSRVAALGAPLLLALLALVTLSATMPATADDAPTTVTVERQVVQPAVKRFGINLGAHNTYDASLLLKNVIPNPGFEAGEMAMLFVVRAGPLPTATQTLTDSVQFRYRVQANNWRYPFGLSELQQYGQPDGFWDGAAFEIVTGAAAGVGGSVVAFVNEGAHQSFYLTTTQPAPLPPAAGDAIAVRMAWAGAVAGCCGAARHVADPAERRPGSPGRQALRLLPPGAEDWYAYRFYVDSYGRDGDRAAGQLLVADGTWRLTFWARAAQAGEPLSVRVRRAGEGQPRFFTATTALSTTWQLISYTIPIAPGADRLRADLGHAPFGIEMFLSATSDAVWIDDIFFGRVGDANPTVFSDRVVAALRALQPGVLRNWGDQLGSSLANELAPASARRTTGWSPVQTRPVAFHYSLHDFLTLADLIGAEPWYVIPPTFSAAEMADLAAYLAAPLASGHPLALLRAARGQPAPWTTRFDTIHLEFGNELWGSGYEDDPFWGATVHGGQNAARLAAARFAALRASAWYTSGRFNLVVGGQAFYPPTNQTIAVTSGAHDALALAPYFGLRFNDWSSPAALVYPLFANPTYSAAFGPFGQSAAAQVDADGRLMLYEINFHTTRGALPIEVRNAYVSGLAGGLALPLHMLTYLRDFGAREQAVFELAQFSTPVDQPLTPQAATARDFARQLQGAPPPPPAVRAADPRTFVRLWGALRDLEATAAPRPTYLGVQLVNRALRGDLLATVHSGADPGYVQPPANGISTTVSVPFVQSFALRDGTAYALLLFNLHLTQTQTVVLVTPYPADGPLTRTTLSAAGIFSGNEEAPTVGLTSVSQMLTADGRLLLPPHSLTLVEWTSRVPLTVATAQVRTTAWAARPWSLLPALLLAAFWLVWRDRSRRRHAG